jgi:hypothetical protein
MCARGLWSLDSGDGPVADPCEHGNDTSGSTKGENILGHLSGSKTGFCALEL